MTDPTCPHAAHNARIAELEAEVEAARASGAKLYSLVRDYLDCSECHGAGIHWTDIDGEAEPDMCVARIALEEFDASALLQEPTP